MEKQPEKITICNLECVLMPNGEVILLGKKIGWFKDLKDYLQERKQGEFINNLR